MDARSNKTLQRALIEIGEIQNLSLLKENEYLARLLGDRSKLPFDLSNDFQAAFANDVVGWRAPGRFLKRLGKEIYWRISGKRPSYYIPFANNRSYLLENVRDHAWLERVPDSLSKSGRRYQRSLKVWQRFAAKQGNNGYLKSIKPHAGRKGPLRVFVFSGGGGLGDAILYAPLLAAIKERLNGCEITLACPAAGIEFYAHSPVVRCALAGEWSETIQAAEAAVHTDMFDLVVFSRCFIPVFQLCAGTRIKDPQTLDWIRTQQETARMLERFGTNLGISILDRMLNTHYLNFFAMATGLPISADSPIGFVPDPAARKSYKAFRLPKRYVTVRDGANPGDTEFARDHGAARTNKQLSPEKWKEILAWLKAQKIRTVQVGGPHDPLLPKVDLDLRGRTSLSELSHVMKGGITHIDTEGGLAHFARAIEHPSVIFFPTTSAYFFGYPQNLNISSNLCARCWYANETWLVKCPRGTAGPECVANMNIKPMKAFILERSNRRSR